MPMIVAAGVGAYVAAGATTYIAGAIGAGIVATVAGGIVGGLAAGVVASAITPKPHMPSMSELTGPANLGQQDTPQSALVNATTNYGAVNPVYGSRRIGGIRVLTEITGPNKEYLNLVIVWGAGPWNAISQVYLDDVAYTDSSFSGLVTCENYTGTDTQAASAALIAELGGKWTSAHQLRGVAYTYLRLKWDQTAFPRGLPVVTADVQGNLVYDPRDATTKFSNTPWLCIRDYLTSTRYGCKAPSAMIDDTTFIAEANYADAAVSIPTASGTTTQARYACDGVVNIDQSRFENLRAMLSSCRGFLVFSGGVYKAKSDKATTAETFTLTEDNIVGAWRFSLPQKRTRFNRVRANFVDSANLYQPNVAVQDSAAYRVIDGNALLEASVDLPFTTDTYRASQVAMQVLKQSRLGISCSLTATIAALRLEVGDVVPLTHSAPGWISKLFRVMGIQLLANDEVSLSLAEYDVAVYTLDSLTFVASAPATNLPNPRTVAAPGIVSVTETLHVNSDSSGVTSLATVTIGASADQYVQSGGRYQLQSKLSTDSTWLDVYVGLDTTAPIDNLAIGRYDFRVRAINSAGAVSAWSGTFSADMNGRLVPPSDPTGFVVQAYAGQARFTWNKPALATDIDVLTTGRALIRWNPATSAVTWEMGVLLNDEGYPAAVCRADGPLNTGTYMLKFRDPPESGGKYSDTEAVFVVTEALFTALTGIATVTESPSFTGAKTSVAVVDSSALQLANSINWDSIPGNMDSWAYVDAMGGLSTTGTYVFANTLDCVTVATTKLYANIVSNAFDANDMWDERTGLMDDWGTVDGDGIEDAEIFLECRITTDDPAGAPTWGPWHDMGLVSDYYLRAAQFRVQFSTGSPTHNRRVTTLAVTSKR